MKNLPPHRLHRRSIGRSRRRLSGEQLLRTPGRYGQRRHGDETRFGIDLLQPGSRRLPGFEVRHLGRRNGYPLVGMGLGTSLAGERIPELAHREVGQQDVHPAAHVHQLQAVRALGRGPGLLHAQRLVDELGRQLVGGTPHPGDQPRGLHLPAHRLVQDLRPSLDRCRTDDHVGQLRPRARHAARRR